MTAVPAIIVPDTIYDLPNEDYHRGEPYTNYLSSTQIKHYLISPKFARYAQLHPEQFSINPDSAEKGSLYHDAMESIVNHGSLDHWRNNLLIFEPPINPKTNCPYGRDTQKYTNALIEAQADNPGKTLTSQSSVQLVETMVWELLNNCRETSRQIQSMLRWSTTRAEVSHFVEYEGCKFKYRPDVETKKKIYDWKTLAVDDLHEDTVNRTILKFGYHISAAFYQFFEHVRTGVWKEFYWVMQQKTAPYDAIMVSAANWAFSWEPDASLPEGGVVHLGVGATIFMKLLRQHIFCMQHNDFDGAQVFIQPGFRGRRILMPEPPGYTKSEIFNFYNKND